MRCTLQRKKCQRRERHIVTSCRGKLANKYYGDIKNTIRSDALQDTCARFVFVGEYGAVEYTTST